MLCQRFALDPKNPLPKDAEGITELADKIYVRMVERENEAVAKIQQVIQFATNDDCRCTPEVLTSVLSLFSFRFTLSSL